MKHGLRINGKEVKLKGGCLHHDNGPIGVVTVYDAEARKVKKLKEVVKIQKENISTAYEAGVSFLMGSDCGVIDHGRNLGELKYLVDVGLSPLEAIQAGTIDGARFFNQENDLGSIEAGKIADMIIVKENPIDKIESLADNDNVLTVIKDGEIVKHKPIF